MTLFDALSKDLDITEVTLLLYFILVDLSGYSI